MEGQHQVQRRHHAVQAAPGPIGQQALPQRQHHQGQQGVEGPLPQVLGGAAPIHGPGQDGVACRAPGGPPDVLDQPAGFLGPPVHDRSHGGADAGPFVQAVDLVHAAQGPFHPALAQRQQHDQRHHADAPNAAEVQRLLAQLPPERGLRHASAAHPGGRHRHPRQGQPQPPRSERDPHTHTSSLLVPMVRRADPGRPARSQCLTRLRSTAPVLPSTSSFTRSPWALRALTS